MYNKITILLIIVVLVNCDNNSTNSTTEDVVPNIELSPVLGEGDPSCNDHDYYETHTIPIGAWSNSSPVVCPHSDGGDGYLLITSSGPITRLITVYVRKWNSALQDWEYYYQTDIEPTSGSIYIKTHDWGSGEFANLNGDELFKLIVEAPIINPIGGGGSSSTNTIYTRLDLAD